MDKEYIDKTGKEIYDWAKGNGFWEHRDMQNKAEKVMLMVSELGEALEGHRKDKRANPDGLIFEPYDE